MFRQQVARFQSRNRGSFDFKNVKGRIATTDNLFQSRNRGSFDFKQTGQDLAVDFLFGFQSRNRGSFDFKAAERLPGSKRTGEVSIS